MSRKTEKILLICGGVWNVFTATVTILGYSGWFRKEGLQIFTNANEVSYLSASLVDSLVNVIMIFGLFMLLIGIANLFLAKFLEHHKTDKRIITWLFFCIVIQFFSFDLIGVFLYLSAVVIYCARNRALKILTK